MQISFLLLVPFSIATLFAPIIQSFPDIVFNSVSIINENEIMIVEEVNPEFLEEVRDEVSELSKAAEKPLPDILERIAYCESGGQQFYENGDVIRGIVNPLDIGKFQINLFYHGERAEELNIDLFTEEGNTEFALLLFNEQGVLPWVWSKPCWG